MNTTHTPEEAPPIDGAIEVIPDDLKLAIVREDPAFEELMADRRKLLRKVDAWEPVESPDDSPRMEEAKRLRLDLVKNRTALDRLRKAVGDKAHKVWRATNEVFKPLIDENSEAEDFLKESEEFAKRFEESRKAEVAAERAKKILPFLLNPDELKAMQLGEITEETFGFILSAAQDAANARAEKALEEQRQRDADRRRAQEAEAALAEERRKHAEEQKRLFNEKAGVDAVLAETKRVKEALEAEKRQQEEAARKKAEEEKKAAAKAARAPDKEKLIAWLKGLTEAVGTEANLKLRSGDGLLLYRTVASDIYDVLLEAQRTIEAL